MTEYSEPDAYARQGMGVALIASSLLFGIFEWVISFDVPTVSMVGTLLVAGVFFLWIGTWESNKIIEEETNDVS